MCAKNIRLGMSMSKSISDDHNGLAKSMAVHSMYQIAYNNKNNFNSINTNNNTNKIANKIKSVTNNNNNNNNNSNSNN